jgi:SAM-dependent methyltransferase
MQRQGMSLVDPRELFGQTDIYIIDQVLRGRIQAGMRILDAGCGGGRNLHYFLRAGFSVQGIDPDPAAVAAARELAMRLAPGLPRDAFRVAKLEDHDLPGESVDVVFCNAVLHFARDDDHFRAILRGAWRTLVPGGIFFARLASSIGFEDRVKRPEGRVGDLPDGSRRYLVDEALLVELTRVLGGELLDPLKTTNVQGLRCMTTWVVRKGLG